MCLSPFSYALQDVVFPSVYLLRASPAAPRDEQGRGKNTSPDLGRHLHIPSKDFLVTLHHFPALCCRPKEQTQIQSHHFACSVLGLHPEGRKKPLTLRLPTFPRHSTIELNSFKHSQRTSEKAVLPHATFHPFLYCVNSPLHSYTPLFFPPSCLFWSYFMF